MVLFRKRTSKKKSDVIEGLKINEKNYFETGKKVMLQKNDTIKMMIQRGFSNNDKDREKKLTNKKVTL